jgi:hypothetical protein
MTVLTPTYLPDPKSCLITNNVYLPDRESLNTYKK